MNDLERDLLTALRDATAATTAPPGVTSVASHRAHRIRRRRAATGGAFGLASVAATSLAVPRIDGDERLLPAVTASATASGMTTFTVTITDGPCPDEPGKGTCAVWTMETSSRAHGVQIRTSADVGRVGPPDPATVVLEFTDGSSARGEIRRVSPGRWEMHLPIEAGLVVRRLQVLHADGTQMLASDVAPEHVPSPG